MSTTTSARWVVGAVTAALVALPGAATADPSTADASATADPSTADASATADPSVAAASDRVAAGQVGRWPAADACRPGDTQVTDTARAGSWDPITPSKWSFTNGEVILHEPGQARPGPRRPFEYAVLTAGPAFGSVSIDAELRMDTPVSFRGEDVIVVFGWTSDTSFYYAHLSDDHTIYPHNGIFKVDGADRERIDHQWDGTVGADRALTDNDWHRVRITHCVETGRIAVYLDGAPRPLMTARDRTFDGGRVGFGSFDNTGRIRDLTVTGVAPRS